jgi:hypothetical protein
MLYWKFAPAHFDHVIYVCRWLRIRKIRMILSACESNVAGTHWWKDETIPYRWVST